MAERQVEDLRIAYRKLNESYKAVLVFHIGESAGFFSEYNCMILTMLYCLQHQIQFRLYSKDANFGYEKGWNDYFMSFCKEENSSWYHKINMRPSGSWKNVLRVKSINLVKWKLKRVFYSIVAKIWKQFHPNLFLTQDIWTKALSKEQIYKTYKIPELGINGNISEACNVLVKITWMYREDIKNSIYAYIQAERVVCIRLLPHQAGLAHL